MGIVPWIITMTAAAVGSSLPQNSELVLNEPQTGAMGAGEIRSYSVSLLSGHSYILTLQQRGLDFVITLEQPGGTENIFNSPMLRQEPERLLLEPARDGVYTIRLTTDEHTGARGGYAIEVSKPALENRQGKILRAALQHETRAASLYNKKGGTNAWNEVVDAYRDALAHWQELGDRRAQGRAHFAIARVLYSELTDWTASLREAKAAASLYRETGQESLHASARHLEAAAMIEEATQVDKQSSKPDDASPAMFDKARTIFLDAADTKSVFGEQFEYARIINDIGLSYYYQGIWDKARAHFAEAATAFHTASEWSEELLATMNLGVINQEEGRLAEALDSYTKALELIPSGKLSDLRGIILDNMSTVYLALGEIDDALGSSLQALELHEARGELKAQGQSLGDIGVTYYLAGDLPLALEYLERALQMRRRANDGRGQVAALRYLGSIYYERKQTNRAIAAHREAMALAASSTDRAKAGILLGRDLAFAGKRQEALEVLTQAINDARQSTIASTRASTLVERGAALRADGRLADARTDLETAQKLFNEFGMLSHQARTHYELAHVSRDSAEFDKAMAEALSAIELVEHQRGQITNPDLRAAFLGANRNYYHFYIDLLMTRYFATDDTDYLEAAFKASERARARTLADLLAESSIDIQKGISVELRHRERTLHEGLAELRYRHEDLLTTASRSDQVEEVLHRLRRVEAELVALETKIRRESPGYADLTAPAILDVADIQQGLDPDTLLIHYALGEPRSYVFTVTRDSVRGFLLPSGDFIESLAHRVHENLSVRSGRPVKVPDSAILEQLSRHVLSPLRKLLTKRRVIVVADGALHYVPFAALLRESGSDGSVPMLMMHEVVSVPSMSVLAARRQQARTRPQPLRTLAIFADPIFTKDDSRFVEQTYPVTVGAAAQIKLSRTGSSRLNSFQRLPETGEEAAVISSLVAEDQRFVATGFAVNRDALLAEQLQDYRIIHFATHGLIDARYPALSALALSFYDAERSPIDGLLRLHDIYNIELNADLVVLSACDAALGREVRGEGLVGLTRGFLYAGASMVVASLWQVPDRATATLMERFYDAHLRQGKSPTAALREAQLSIASEPRWRDPYYWAPFLAMGDWQYGRE